MSRTAAPAAPVSGAEAGAATDRGRGRSARARLSAAASPRLARRMSGPAAGVVAVPLPRLPSRPSVPVPRRPGSRSRRRADTGRIGARAGAGLAGGLRQALLDLPDHRLLDRLIRGRAWIGLIGFALIGIVAMQVSLLKLNTGIGRDVQRTAALEQQNAALQAQVSRLDSTDRIQAAGEHLGLVAAPAGEVLFLTVRPGLDARRASARVRQGATAPAATSPTLAAPTGTAASASAGTATAGSAGTATAASAASAPAVSGPAASAPAASPPAATAARPGTSQTATGAPATGAGG